MHELLLHIMPRLRLDEVKGTWQTRRLEDTGIVICNSADTTLPITLDIPCEVRGLQHCVQSWHSQHYRTALIADHPTIVVSICPGTGVMQGAASAKTPVETVRPPVFCTPDALSVQWQPYKVYAMALHFGEHLQRGHYRMLAPQGQNPHQSVWLTDDNHPAQPASFAELCTQSSCVSLVVPTTLRLRCQRDAREE